jgi:hypothetical protein
LGLALSWAWGGNKKKIRDKKKIRNRQKGFQVKIIKINEPFQIRTGTTLIDN